MKPSLGRIVIYRITAQEAEEINRRRIERVGGGWPTGAQAHVGNRAIEGNEYPMIVTSVFGADLTWINGQVLLDGSDSLWALSKVEGNNPGEWHWPIRMEEKQ